MSLTDHVYRVWVDFIAGGSPGWAAYDTTEAVDERATSDGIRPL